jgi:hypothetical protein
MIVIAGVGIPLDAYRPARSGAGNLKMIKYGTAAENYFAAGAVGVDPDPRMICEQMQGVVGGEHPPPRLTVVQ